MKNQTRKATRARNARPPITPPATGPAMLFRGRGVGLGVAVLVIVVCEPEEVVVVVVVEVLESLLVKVTVKSFQ